MQQSPVTDKTLGIVLSNPEKFRDVRGRAKEADVKLRKSHKNKPPKPAPLHKVDEEVVVVTNRWGGGPSTRHYGLARIVDFEEDRVGYEYYGILLKTTDPKRADRLGRLIRFSESQKGFWMEGYVERVKDLNIRWKATLE